MKLTPRGCLKFKDVYETMDSGREGVDLSRLGRRMLGGCALVCLAQTLGEEGEIDLTTHRPDDYPHSRLCIYAGQSKVTYGNMRSYDALKLVYSLCAYLILNHQ